jgi:hypothetical protein
MYGTLYPSYTYTFSSITEGKQELPEFVAGDRIKVEFEGVHTGDAFSSGCFNVKAEGTSGREHTIPKSGNGYTITRADPVSWPPKQGDVWTDKAGTEYHVMKSSYGTDLSIYTDAIKSITEAGLRNKPGVKLAYRK